jgi:hypothetical protein
LTDSYPQITQIDPDIQIETFASSLRLCVFAFTKSLQGVKPHHRAERHFRRGSEDGFGDEVYSRPSSLNVED